MKFTQLGAAPRHIFTQILGPTAKVFPPPGAIPPVTLPSGGVTVSTVETLINSAISQDNLRDDQTYLLINQDFSDLPDA